MNPSNQSIEDFCDRYGIGRTTVYEEIRSGRLGLSARETEPTRRCFAKFNLADRLTRFKKGKPLELSW
jgi:hypothetical protein